MSNPIQAAIEARASVNHFQPGHPLGDELITSLVAQATRAPSAYNMQNWRFIAVRSEAAKARLKAVAHGQQKVVDASVSFIVCGVVGGHRQLATVLQPSVDAGIMTQRTADGWVAQAHGAHEGHPVLQRDEAVRSASLAAMTLMMAAQGMGLGTCAMVGFDASRLSQAFDLSDAELPVVLVAVGHCADGSGPQKPRRPVSEVFDVL